MFGGDLLSHAVTRAVPSAQKGLASGFGMEPGVSPSLSPPKLYGDISDLPDRISGTAQWTRRKNNVSNYRLISTGQLHVSLVHTSTSGLSTQWSTGSLSG